MKRPFLLFLLCLIFHQVQALNPSRTYKQLPDKYNMKYTPHTVSTKDGAKLKAWHFPASTKSKTTKLILICHSGEGNMADYLRRVDQFTSIGYNVVTFDYRGYGESSDFEIDKNMYIYPHYTKDVNAMIDFCRKQYVATFDMYGWGIGGGLSLGIGYNRKEIKKIIADTPFLSMEDLESRFEDWEEPMEVPFAGYDKKYEPIYTLDNPPSIAEGQTKKVKLIIGSNDVLFEKSDMEKLVSKRKKVFDSSIYVVENPDRKDNFKSSKEGYMKDVKTFLAS